MADISERLGIVDRCGVFSFDSVVVVGALPPKPFLDADNIRDEAKGLSLSLSLKERHAERDPLDGQERHKTENTSKAAQQTT